MNPRTKVRGTTK